MLRIRKFSAIISFTLILISAPSIQAAGEYGKKWWTYPYPKTFDSSVLKNELDFISVDGNRFVNEQGQTVIFKGVSIADPDKLIKDRRWSRDIFQEVKRWGANVIRLPVHPISWRERGKEEYLGLLDQALIWANELKIYLIIDWHSIGNLHTGVYQHPMYDTSIEETFNFWRAIAYRYQDISTIAFYEIFNEPTDKRQQFGVADWNKWKAFYEETISLIYAHDKKVIPLVAGFRWAYTLTEVRDQPIEREGIAYVSHPYPTKADPPYVENWEKDFGYVADKYPLFATEIGYMLAGLPGAHSPVIDDGRYGKRINDYLDSKGASWVAWVFDPEWSPQMIADWNYTPTMQGKFFKKVMLENTAANAD